MATWDNNSKQGVYAPLWGNSIYPWQLDLPWNYVNPTPISFSNTSKNSSSWGNSSKAVSGYGTPIGLLLALTKAGTSQITWTNQSKN